MQTAKYLLLLTIFLSLPVIAQSKRQASISTPTWQFESEARTVLQANGIEKSKHPKLYLRTSSLYLLAVTNDQLTMSVSSDGGDSFEPPVLISEPNATVSSHGENSPTLAINGIEFYALWEQSNATGGTDLMFARSLRFGRKFDKPIKITGKEKPSSNAFSYLAVAPNGDLYAVWLDARDPQHTMPGTSHVYMTKSTDKGATWSKNFAVANNVCPCCRPTIVFGVNGEVMVAWRNVTAGDVRDMMLAISTDNGATFGPPTLIAHDNWKISGCPHSGPSLLLKGKRLYAAWHSEGDGTNAGIRLTWSDDGGRTFAKPTIASHNIVDTNHPMLSLSEDGRLLMVFKGRDAVAKESWGAVSPYLVEVNDNGTVSMPLIVPGNKKSIAYPVLVAGTVGRAYLAWTESGQLKLTRARRTNLQAALKPQTESRGAVSQASKQDHSHH